MDYDNILQRLGGFGHFQKRMMFLLMVPPFLDPLTSYMLTFILGEHRHTCRIPDHVNTLINTNITVHISECSIYVNGSETLCTEWDYDQSQYTSTLISSFNMVCGNKFVRSHMMLCHYIGLFLGSLTTALLCDVLGRRPVLIAMMIGMFLPNFIRSWVYNVPLVGFLIFANGYCSQTLYQTAFILATELVDPSKRVFTNFLIYFIFCMGAYVLLLFAYFVRDWRYLGWYTSAVVGACLVILFFQKESPRWLIAKGKLDQAETILKDMANENKVSYDIDTSQLRVKEMDEIGFVASLKQLAKSKILIIRWAIFCFNWFAISMTYFGITMKVGNLGGDVYINYLISTSAETVAIITCLFVVDRFGRKRVISSSMLICGVSCLSTIFSSLYGGHEYHWITITLAMVGKLFITLSYFNIYLMICETFPTVLRSFALGICSCCGRIGAMVSAYVGDLGVHVDTEFGLALPLIIFGAFGLSAGIASLWLPETTNIPLPQTIEDAEQIGRFVDKNKPECELISVSKENQLVNEPLI